MRSAAHRLRTSSGLGWGDRDASADTDYPISFSYHRWHGEHGYESSTLAHAQGVPAVRTAMLRCWRMAATPAAWHHETGMSRRPGFL